MKISEDMEQPFRDRLTQVCKDLDHFREGYNKLRYENTFLKSEYEHEQAERKRVMEEMKSQHEAEVRDVTNTDRRTVQTVFIGLQKLNYKYKLSIFREEIQLEDCEFVSESRLTN